MELDVSVFREREAWEKAHVAVPDFDWEGMVSETLEHPTWVHFGAGNVFRAFIAPLQQTLLEKGRVKGGIIAAETYDYEVIDSVWEPHENLSLLVTLNPDGTTTRRIIASVGLTLRADPNDDQQMAQLTAAFEARSLQMVSFTVTEKGYALTDDSGNLLPAAAYDMTDGPEFATHVMGRLCALMLQRYRAGHKPLALVSMDQCSHNGERLRNGLLAIARAWLKNGFVDQGFVTYLADERQVSFPWSMIDKRTPPPDSAIASQLAADGMDGMEPICTSRETCAAPFANAEAPQYLLMEDRFPNGRPPLEEAGVIFADRPTVTRAEFLRDVACLMPLTAALAVFGCLLGIDRISSAMADPDLNALVHHIGYDEELPVAEDSDVLHPADYLAEVIQRRLPNPLLPDTPPQVTAHITRTLPLCFGKTVAAWMRRPAPGAASLTGIPLVLAGWLRCLCGTDDAGHPLPMDVPLALNAMAHATPDSLPVLLSDEKVFGVDLVEASLAQAVMDGLTAMLGGNGCVRETLHRAVQTWT